MLPVDLMVELLMANLPHNWMWTLDGKSVSGSSRDELEKEVRTYLESLVPAQKLLSECEEYKNVTTQGETVVYRVGRDVYRSVDNMWVGYAENVQAKPVEVNRE